MRSEPDVCICRKWAKDDECPVHGNPGQLTIEQTDDTPESQPPDTGDYDPAISEIPY